MLRKRWLTVALLVALVGVWQLVASLHGVGKLLLASPGETADALWHNRTLLLDNADTGGACLTAAVPREPR